MRIVLKLVIVIGIAISAILTTVIGLIYIEAHNTKERK